MRRIGVTLGIVVLCLSAAPGPVDADGRPRGVRGDFQGSRRGDFQGSRRGEFHGSRRGDHGARRFDGRHGFGNHHGFVNRPGFTVFVSPFFDPFFDPPTVAAPPVVYQPAPQYAPPPPYFGPQGYGPQSYGGPQVYAAPPSPPMPRVVEFPNGRYELRGDGVYSPYSWVWIPNPPVAPPPPPPPTAPPAAAPEQAPARRPTALTAVLYRWTDEQGVTTWTDNIEKVPVRYRGQVNRLTP
jgi:hypothetical protein